MLLTRLVGNFNFLFSSSFRMNCTELVENQLMHLQRYLSYDSKHKTSMEKYIQCILPLPEADVNTGCFLHFMDSKLQKQCLHHLGQSRPIFEMIG